MSYVCSSDQKHITGSFDPYAYRDGQILLVKHDSPDAFVDLHPHLHARSSVHAKTRIVCPGLRGRRAMAAQYAAGVFGCLATSFGRASCRESVCRYGSISVVAVSE